MQRKKTMAWGWIIFWFIFFWPVGIVLLFKKLHDDKSAMLKNSKIISVISFILIGMSVIYIMMSTEESSSEVVTVYYSAAFVCGGGGIWVNIIARNMRKKAEKYRKYISLVINQQLRQIDSIASSMGIPYDAAKKDLQQMIDSEYFLGAYIDDSTRKIGFGPGAASDTVAPQAQAETQLVICRSCGANNMVVAGQVKECDYCGSPIT